MLKRAGFTFVFILTFYVVFKWLSPYIVSDKGADLSSMFRRLSVIFEKSKSFYKPAGGVKNDNQNAAESVLEIKRMDKNLVTAAVRNAVFEECGVLTGDYTIFSKEYPDYIDYVNGWESGQARDTKGLKASAEVAVSSSARHFGEKGIEVINAYGPSRNFKLTRNRNYVFSAWIKIAYGDLTICRGNVIGVDYRCLDRSRIDWPIRTVNKPIPCSGEISAEKHDGGWYFLKMTVPAEKDIPPKLWNAGYQVARIYIGVPNGDGKGGDAAVYIDDIRFYPVDSEVRSYYYPQNSSIPIACVGQDNMPGCETGNK